MRLLHEIAIFQTVKSKVIISLFETVRLSVSISLRNLYNSLNSIKEICVFAEKFYGTLSWGSFAVIVVFQEMIGYKGFLMCRS